MELDRYLEDLKSKCESIATKMYDSKSMLEEEQYRYSQVTIALCNVAKSAAKLDFCKTQPEDPYDFLADRNAAEEVMEAIGKLRVEVGDA